MPSDQAREGRRQSHTRRGLIVWLVLIASCAGDSIADPRGAPESRDGAVIDATTDPLATFPMSADAPRGEPRTDTAPSICVEVCGIGAQLPCPMPIDCLAACEFQMRSSCKNAVRALWDCARTKTVDDFYCAPSGASEIKPAVCQLQREVLMMCVFTGRDLP